MSLAVFAPGDIFVTASDLDPAARFPTGQGKVLQYDRAWTLKATHQTGQYGLISALVLDDARVLHILDPQARWTGAIGPDGEPRATFPKLPKLAFGSMIPHPDGAILAEHMVGDIPGFSGKGHVYRVDDQGTLRDEWDTETNGGMGGFLGVTHMALAADGATLYHLSETGAHIYAHDLKRNARLGPIYSRADPPPMLFGVEALADGSVLVAAATEIRRIEPGKGIVQRYRLPAGRGWSVVKLRPGGRSFWALDFFGGQLASVAIDSGTVEVHRELGLAKCLAGIAEVPGGDAA